MTMIPPADHNRLIISQLQHRYGGGGGGGCGGAFGHMNGGGGYEYNDYCCRTSEANNSNCLLGSDLALFGSPTPMADDGEDSRTESSNMNEAAASSAKDDAYDQAGWLQLSIGGAAAAGDSFQATAASHDKNAEHEQRGRAAHGGLVELDLLPGPSGGGGGDGGRSTPVMRPSFASPIFHFPEAHQSLVSNLTTPGLFFQPGTSSFTSFGQHHQGTNYNWAYRPMIPPLINTIAAAAPTPPSSLCLSSSSVPPTAGSYFNPPFHQLLHGGRPSLDFRVIDPPRRPHSGVWFMLQASPIQAKEPFLPQIPKSYLRIKNGSMTVRLLMKYLVNKLRLDSESEIEITCRGQLLLPFLTLQHVRDNVWSPRDAVTLLPDSSTADHVMVLHYARRA